MAGLQELLMGASETTFIEVEGFDEQFEVRKLNVREVKKYESIINKSLGKVKSTERDGFRNSGREAAAEVDIAKATDAEYAANVYLIKTSFSINGEKYSEEEILNNMGADIFSNVVSALKDLNNLNKERNTEEEVKKP